MGNPFLSLLFQCIFILLLLALAMTGVDAYFNIAGSMYFFDIFEMNVIFSLGGGFIMLLIFILMLSNEVVMTNIFRDDTVMTIFGLFVSCIMMYFVKNYLMTRYGVVFNFPNIIIFLELGSIMVIPFIVNRFLRKFGKAFAH